MKRVAIVLLSLVPLLALAAPASAKRLPFGEAKLQSRLVMSSFTEKKGNLSYPKAYKCKRKSRRKIKCQGVSTGETQRKTIRCNMAAVVVNKRVRYNFGAVWEAKAKLVKKKCKSTAKPYLEESRAREAAQAEADRVAGQPTTLEFLLRSDDVTFSGYATWEKPGEDSFTDYCFVDITVKLSNNRVTAKTEGLACI